jgi:mannose-6-phosphate isomerase-like protein (cupin superfamily)
MAIITGPEGIDLEAALMANGVRFVHAATGADAPADVIAGALRPDERQIRLTALAVPPAAGEENSGMGAWHVNAEDEAHFVRSGRGIVQFVIAEGVVSVEVLPGDVMILQRAEHRYRPIEEQEWVMRHSGAVDAGLDPRETGRAPGPWPDAH